MLGIELGNNCGLGIRAVMVQIPGLIYRVRREVRQYSMWGGEKKLKY